MNPIVKFRLEVVDSYCMLAQFAPTVTSAAPRAGRYLIFDLGEKTFGIPVLHTREIIALKQIVTVPNAPAILSGTIDLRGRTVPIVNLRRKFGLAPSHNDAAVCIVIVQIEGLHVGVAIDRVVELANLEDIQRERTLLDVDRLLTPAERECFETITEKKRPSG